MNTTSKTSSLLRLSSEDIHNIRRNLDLDKPGKIEEAVDILEDWIKLQRHFRKRNFGRHFLEMTIIQCKGSVERAKSRIDKYCTLKTMLPKYFEKTDPKTDFEDYHSSFYCAVLPKLVGDHCRICLVKGIGTPIPPNCILDFYRLTLMIAEYVLGHDYFNGVILVFDYLNINTTELVAALNPIEMGEALKLYTECIGLRLKGFHFITPSKMVQVVVTMLRQVVSQKLGDRIHVHKNLDSLFQVLPREAFPEEYGGKEKPTSVLRDEWIELLTTDESRKFLQEMRKATTDEDQRDKYEFNIKYMGTPGTFRTLKVD